MLRIKNSNPLRSTGLHKRSLFQSSGKFFHGRSQQVEHVAKRGFVVCVICYTPYSYPVTFIRAHIQRLPAKVIVLYGRYFRAAGQDGEIVACTNGLYGRSLLPWVYRLSRKISRRFLRSGSGGFEKAVLRKFLVEHKVDAVLAEFGPAAVATMEACEATNTPLIVYFRGDDAYCHPALERNGYPELFQHAAAIFAVSRDMVRHLVGLGAPAEKLYYNPSGVDTRLFRGADPAHAPPVFVVVGRFTDKKAPHLTLLAFSKAVECVPEARLVMIGDGTLLEACKQLARALDVADAVEFLGEKTHEEVAVCMRRARAFVQHSMKTSSGRSEGTPNAVLEAGACGLPVVATRHAGIKEVVIDGETGLLVDEGDVVGMAEHIVRLAKDPNLAARLGQAAREHISAEFTMEKRIGNLWRVIRASIGEHRCL